MEFLPILQYNSTSVQLQYNKKITSQLLIKVSVITLAIPS